MGRLRILTAGIEPAVLDIPADVVTLGRREDNALCVPHASVSGRHCELGESDDSLTILDLGSTNGTFIKGQRIEQGTVAAGDTFQLGGVELRYEVGAMEAAPAAPQMDAPTPEAKPAPAPAVEVAPAPAPAAVAAVEPATVASAAPAPAPAVEKPKSVFPPMPPQPKPGAPLMPKPPAAGGAAVAAPQPGAVPGVKPPLQKSAASLLPTDNPAAKPPAQPLVGSGPKVITPPSAPPKFSLGHHAKPPAAPAPSATPESAPPSAAAATPEPAHGASPAPGAPKPPQPAQPLSGAGPKIIVPPSGPPKFSLGGHAKPHAAPAAPAAPESTPPPAAAAAPEPAHGAAPAPAAPKPPQPAQPLSGAGPKIIVPPSGPPKFSLGGHAKPHAAPAASPKPEGTPSPEAAAAPAPKPAHDAAPAPAAPKPPQPAQPLSGAGPKIIVPPSGPPKFSLGGHAKPHAAPATPAAPESAPPPAAATAPEPAHGAAAAPAAPKPPPSAQPLSGAGPKIIVPPSGPPKFSLGGHAKPHAAPAASPKPESTPSPEAAATPAPEHGAAATPAAPATPKPAVPLSGGGPKIIVPPSGPPKFSLGGHAKPHAAPAASPKPEDAPSPEAAATPAPAHGAAAAPAAPAAPKPAVPLSGGGPKVIVPPSAPPKFSLGGHAKPHAAPAAPAAPESAPPPAAAAAPEPAHGAAPAPTAPKPPQPAQPLSGAGPKIIVPPSGPPKFSLGGHAKPHAAPAAPAAPESAPPSAASAEPEPAHGAAPAPAAPKPPQPPQPLSGAGPKIIVPPSGPPKFSLGGHAKPHAAPATSPKPEGTPSPEAAAAPEHEHGATAAPAAPKPAVPLSGGGPKVIVPPSAPPKFSLGGHAKPHAAPSASPGAAPAPPAAPAAPAAPAVEAEPIAEVPADATTEDTTEPTTSTAPDSATETATETAAESTSESSSEVAADPAPDAPAPDPPAPDPPAPVAATAAPTAAVSQSAPAKNENRCARHPANVAQYICPKCRAYACDTCGSLSAARGKPKIFCPVCGAKTQPLAEFEKAQAARQAREDLSFQQQVKGVFKYPFGKGGLALLIVGSLMFFGLDVLVTWGWKFRFMMLKAVSSVGILATFSAGYLCAYLQKILFATAQGEDEVPGWPDFTNWKDDIVMPFRLAIAAFVASFGPAFGYLIFHAVNNSEMRLPVLFPLFALGFLYFPMALLAVAISNNWLAVNPLVVMPAIARLNLQYVLACVVFFGMVLARFVTESLLHVVLPIPVLPGLISSFIALYFLCVEMRLLGLLYFTNKKRLGWFST